VSHALIASGLARRLSAGIDKDHRGDVAKHSVIIKITKGSSAPIMHKELSHSPNETEHIVSRDASYKITRRTRGKHGRIFIHMEEV
jgi:hypothetical protein